MTKKTVRFDDNVVVHKIDHREDFSSDNDEFDDSPISNESDDLVTLINTFLQFYKIHYDEPSHYHMFQDIPESKTLNCNTNRCMEMFQKHIDEYQDNQSNDELITIYEVDDQEYNFHLSTNYILTINNKAEKVCHSLLALIKYITIINAQDWIIDVVKID